MAALLERDEACRRQQLGGDLGDVERDDGVVRRRRSPVPVQSIAGEQGTMVDVAEVAQGDVGTRARLHEDLPHPVDHRLADVGVADAGGEPGEEPRPVGAEGRHRRRRARRSVPPCG